MRAPAAIMAVAALAAAATAGSLAEPAAAAFEVRDTDPAALGAASTDLEAPPFFETAGRSPERAESGGTRLAGLRLRASRTALLSVPGLAADRVEVEAPAPIFALECSYEQVEGVGARQRSLRAAVRERAARPISLEVSVERLDLAVEGEPSLGGWALGAGAIAAVPLSAVAVSVTIGCDRLLRSSPLDALRVQPSVAAGIRITAAGAARIAFLDRWEEDGRHSPRIFLDVVLGGSAVVRVARGESPSRTGAALALRLGRLEVAAGRLDLEWGGAMTGASIGLLPAGKPAGER
jgi:hypothetical protein